MAEETKDTTAQETEVVEEEETQETVTDTPETDGADELRKEIKKLRKESAKYRTKGNDIEEQFTSLKDSLAKSLGLKEDENPDNEKLSNELTQLKNKYRQERLRNEFNSVAQKHEADTDLTWAVLQSNGQMAAIDIDGEGFEGELSDIVADAVKNNPKLKNSYKSSSGANPPPDTKKTARDEYNEVKEQVQKNPNDQGLRQKLFILKSRLKEE